MLQKSVILFYFMLDVRTALVHYFQLSNSGSGRRHQVYRLPCQSFSNEDRKSGESAGAHLLSLGSLRSGELIVYSSPHPSSTRDLRAAVLPQLGFFHQIWVFWCRLGFWVFLSVTWVFSFSCTLIRAYCCILLYIVYRTIIRCYSIVKLLLTEGASLLQNQILIS